MSSKIYDPKKEIINTLSYKKIFNQPMSFYQIIYFSHTGFENLNEVEGHLKDLIDRHKIKYKNGFYFLGTYKSKKDDIKELNSRVSIAKVTFEKLEGIKFIFESIPFIKFVGVTGTLASYNFDFEKDDIDLFFICSRNRLWITRFLVVLILKYLNLYVNNSNPKLKICPNLYISEDNLEWKESKRSLYVAHEIAMMQPLVNKKNIYFNFLSSNDWINDFLPNVSFYPVEKETIINSDLTILDLFEDIFRFIQKFFMKVRFGSEILNKDIIHFLKADHSVSVIEDYNKIKN
jgi:hypothetical protein